MRFNEEIYGIATYEVGKPIEEVVRNFGLQEAEIIKLASNENPYGPSPLVVECIRQHAEKASLYPDDSMTALISRLAKHYDIEQGQCIIGSGSDQIIELSFHAKAGRGSKILMAGVTFAMYEIYAKHIGAQVLRSMSREHNLSELFSLFLEHKPEIICLCVPNNPLGDCVDTESLCEFLEKVARESAGECLVLVDGAYQEFAAYKDPSRHITPRELICRFSNVLYLGTFSKAYGLGGMRVGYGIAQEEIIQALYKLRPPFNITTLSLAAACVALEDTAFMQQTVEANFSEMRRYEEFAESKGLNYIPSYTNFITVLLKNPHNSRAICATLLRMGIIIRDLASYHINAVRITIGTPEQNTRVLAALEEALAQSAQEAR